MNETQQKLLDKSVVVLPSELEHDVYEYVLEAAIMHPEPLTLYCTGNGGDTASALAIVDIIREHGQFIGRLPGQANSNHVAIFAACQERYVYPCGQIGVHNQTHQGHYTIDDKYLALRTKEFKNSKQAIAEILASASTHDVKYWLRTMDNAGGLAVIEFDAPKIIEMEMARPIEELRHVPFNENGYKS